MLKLAASKIHLYVGLALGLVMIVLSLTGSALVFREPLERALRPKLHTVAPPAEHVSPAAKSTAPGSRRLALDSLVANARAAYPQYIVTMAELPQRRNATVKLWMSGEKERHAYVNPNTGEVLGAPEVNSGFVGTLFVLHVELFAGPWGAWFVAICGFLLVLLSLTGLILWWPRLSAFWKSVVLTVRYGWKRANYDLHRSAGFWTCAFVVVVALTGSAMYFYYETGDILNWATNSEPLPAPPTVAIAEGATASEAFAAGSSGAPAFISLQSALQTAKASLPEAEATFVSLPTDQTQPLSVRMRAEGEWHPNGRSYVYLHPRTGDVLRVDDARAAPPGSRLLYMLYPLHIGSFGGPIVRWLYMLMGLMPTVLTVTGMIIWFTRWRKTSNGMAESNGEAVPTRPAALPPSLAAKASSP